MFYYQVDDDIQLRILETRYAEELSLLIDKDRNHLRKWLSWVDGTVSIEDMKVYIQHTLNQFAANNGFNAAILYQGELVGCIGLEYIDWMNKNTTIGAWLGFEYQGKGIVPKCCKAIISYAFKDLGLKEVEIRTAEMNNRGRAIPEKLGFKQVCIMKDAEWLHGNFVDHVVYVLSREEWDFDI